MPPKFRFLSPRMLAPWELLAREFGLNPDCISSEVEAVLKKTALKIEAMEAASLSPATPANAGGCGSNAI